MIQELQQKFDKQKKYINMVIHDLKHPVEMLVDGLCEIENFFYNQLHPVQVV
jgi:hypothetical protein